jgi:hypothetical protein
LAFAFVFCQPSPPRRSSPEPSLRRRISRNEIESLDRHEELRVFGVDQEHELAARTACVDRLQRIESSDSMIDVNDVIAGFQIAKIGDERTEFVLLRRCVEWSENRRAALRRKYRSR